MATSLTALYIAEDNLFFAHVGHSAAFLFRDGILTQLTNDHTEEPSAHASHFSDGITRTIGGRRDMPHVDTEHIKLLTGDRLLLCTNGLTDVVTPDSIADTLASRRRPMEDCARLIDLAVDHDGGDDVTAMLADYTLQHAAELPSNGNADVPSPETE
jgi:protein phosphatase